MPCTLRRAGSATETLSNRPFQILPSIWHRSSWGGEGRECPLWTLPRGELEDKTLVGRAGREVRAVLVCPLCSQPVQWFSDLHEHMAETSTIIMVYELCTLMLQLAADRQGVGIL